MVGRNALEQGGHTETVPALWQHSRLLVDRDRALERTVEFHITEFNHCHYYAMRRHTMASLVLVLLPDSGSKLRGSIGISNPSIPLGLFVLVVTQPKHCTNKHLLFYLSRPPRISVRR
jgi:hypothetical protein